MEPSTLRSAAGQTVQLSPKALPVRWCSPGPLCNFSGLRLSVRTSTAVQSQQPELVVLWRPLALAHQAIIRLKIAVGVEIVLCFCPIVSRWVSASVHKWAEVCGCDRAFCALSGRPGATSEREDWNDMSCIG